MRKTLLIIFLYLFTFFWVEIIFLSVCAIPLTTLPNFSWDTSVLLQCTKNPNLKLICSMRRVCFWHKQVLRCKGITLLWSERPTNNPKGRCPGTPETLSVTLSFLKSEIWKNQRPWARCQSKGPSPVGRLTLLSVFGCWVLCRESSISPRANQAGNSPKKN